MRVLICGDRDWGTTKLGSPLITQGAKAEIQEALVQEVVYLLAQKFGADNLTIIVGRARGADKLAEKYALAYGAKVDPYPADWQRYGRSAGPIRNYEMRDNGKPDFVVALHPDIEKSKGTKHMVQISREIGIPCFVINDWGGTRDRFIEALDVL